MPFEVGVAEDVEEFGASRRRESLEALADGLLSISPFRQRITPRVEIDQEIQVRAQRSVTDCYGSEGWGFDSLPAR